MHDDDTQPVLLTTEQLARRVNIGAGKLRQLVREGSIPCIRVGASVRYVVADVVDALRHGSEPILKVRQ